MLLWHVSQSKKTKVGKNNLNNDGHNIFTENVEINTENEVDSVKIITKEKENNVEEEIKQEQEKMKV